MSEKTETDDAFIKQIHKDKINNISFQKEVVPDNLEKKEDKMPEEEVKSKKEETKEEPKKEIKAQSGLPSDVMESVINYRMAQMEAQFEAQKNQFQAKIDSLQESYESKMEKLKEKQEEEIERVSKEKENACNLLRSLGDLNPQGLFTPGVPFKSEDVGGTPYLHVHGSSESKRAFREMATLLSESPTAYSNSSGERILTKDYRQANKFFTKNSEAVLSGLELKMKQEGFLQGNSFTGIKESPTSPGSIPYAFLEVLSRAVERRSHSPRFTFHNILLSDVEIGLNVGTTIKVPRTEWLAEGTSEADYQLDPLIPISTATDPLTGGSIPLEIMEYGRGKNTRAIAIPEFYVATAMEDLLRVLTDKLGRSYQYFKDLTIRQHLYTTTRVVYNKKGSVTTTPGDVIASDKGTMNFDFLSNLYAYMASLQIPAWDENGCYAIFMSPTAFAQLEVDLFQNGRFVDKTGIEQVANMFNKLNFGTSDVIYGYEGKVANFMIFRTNATAVGLPGAEGVNSVNLGVGATTVRSSLAVGYGTVINRVVSPFEITPDPSTDYGRLIKAIWRSIEGYAPADIDPASNPPLSNNQQLRVVEVRTTDFEV